MSEATEKLHRDILDYISNAEGYLARGEFTSLAGLDAFVKTLCERVLTLEVQESTAFAPKLDELMTRLGALQQQMEHARDACKNDVASLEKHQKAATAYAKKGNP